MTKIQIDERLFVELVKLHVLELPVDLGYISTALNEKMEKIALRELYRAYKDNTLTQAEREQAKKEYLERKFDSGEEI